MRRPRPFRDAAIRRARLAGDECGPASPLHGGGDGDGDGVRKDGGRGSIRNAMQLIDCIASARGGA
ncbi:hypothetical protein WS91_09835 [Burkholderia sp. MSMB1498]|nr:hypothetical protein WS91_09835 [Burkholderia sp. MSMB1498]